MPTQYWGNKVALNGSIEADPGTTVNAKLVASTLTATVGGASVIVTLPDECFGIAELGGSRLCRF
ncbi:MAG: hypothetical protein AAGE59_27035, partial [Cyanobacteria bacterium P01_F01_bin.86]